MNKNIIAFFKRNPTAIAAHLVLDQVFDSLKKATAYKKLMSAKMVTSVLRQEYDAWVAKNSAPSPSGDNAGTQ